MLNKKNLLKILFLIIHSCNLTISYDIMVMIKSIKNEGGV